MTNEKTTRPAGAPASNHVAECNHVPQGTTEDGANTRKTIDFSHCQIQELQALADEHHIYQGNVSAIVREAVVCFLEQKTARSAAQENGRQQSVRATLSSKLTVENVPESLMQRLIGMAQRDGVCLSAIVRMCLDAGLPEFRSVRRHYEEAVQNVA